ncbi:MAG: hypothetical protein E7448_04700 [Ruminococcaceae bacterium]|nr:hypothetical protein [Oscillospiraceae bacterium]
MKIRNLLCLILSVFLLAALLFGCAPGDTGSTPEPSTESPTEPTIEERKPMPENPRILFIGNSYTNDTMPILFSGFARAAGYKVAVDTIVKGSHELTLFADPNDTYGARVEMYLNKSNSYDVVVLQEKSILTATEELPKFYTAVRNLHSRITATGAQTVLYSTWGRKTGSAALPQYGLTNETMTWKVAAAYQAMGEELNIPVAFVGLAFYDVYTGDSGIEIYNDDKTHPSYAGNFLSAATLFAEIFQIDPTTVNFNGTLTAQEAAVLKEAARKAVFETPEIPAEYKTSSEGIG